MSVTDVCYETTVYVPGGAKAARKLARELLDGSDERFK